MKYLFCLSLTCLVMTSFGAEPMVWNSSNQFSGWRALRNVKCEAASNALVLTDIDADPQIVSGTLDIDPGKFNRLSFRYRAENVGKAGGELYYAHANGAFAARKMWHIPPLNGDGKWHTVTLTEKNMVNPASWFEGGIISRLRLDPTNSTGGRIEISEIRLFFEPEKKPVVSSGKAISDSLPKVEFKLDAPVWPSVKPEFHVFGVPVVNEPYFAGKMIKSSQDLRSGGTHKSFFLRREFILKAKPVQGWLQYTADDGAEAFINGVEVGRANNWRVPDVAEVSTELKSGKNTLAFHYHNARSAGGVLAELFVKYVDGSSETIDTDRSFKTSVKAEAGWNKNNYDDSSWEPAIEQFGPPSAPWGTKMAYRDFGNPQKFLGSAVNPDSGDAGNKIRFQFDFKGRMPKLPLNVTMTLRNNDSILYDEEFTLDSEQVESIGKDRWRIEMDYTLPLYLRTNQMTARLSSGAIFCKSGGFPEVKFSYRELVKVPGYENAVESSMKKTAYGPTFLLNGKPFFPVWGGVNRKVRPDKLPRHSDAPLNVVTVFAGYDWWVECGKIDTAVFDRHAEEYRRNSKDAWFIWNLSIYPPKDWEQKFPDEMCRDDKGAINRDGRCNHSFVSKQAQRDMEDALGKAITYLENSPYANRIIGYRVTGGHTSEWLGWDPSPGRILDFSQSAQKGFREFAENKYPGLKDFSIPSLEARRTLDDGQLLWDQRKHLNVIAYHDFYSNAVADMLIHLCRKAKRLLNNRKVVGTYYGYTFTLHGGGSSQMRAHYALKKMLNSGSVDFLMSPQAYSIRNIGDTNGDMKPFGSISHNNVLSVIEDDSRTHNGPYMSFSNNYQTLTKAATLGVVNRNLGIALCRNQPIYLYALCAGTEFDFPEMAESIALLREIGEHCQNKTVRRDAKIALVVSEDTIKSMPMYHRMASATGMFQAYQKDGSSKQIRSGSTALVGESFIANATRYARLGAPVDYLLAEDLKDHPGEYSLYIFINCFKYDDAFFKAMEELRQRDCTLFWIYAPGYTFDGKNNVENMKRLTGIDLQKVESPILPAVKLADGQWIGTRTMRIAPMFHVSDAPGVEKLGSYENGQTGFAALKTGKARSIFCGAYQFDVPFLTQLARDAGVHIYSENSDPVEANASLFTLHARFPGVKTVRLPRKTDVLDILNRKIIARKSDSFSFDAPLHSSWLFYYGDDAENLLGKLLTRK